jgi:DNA gyrase subunit A
VAEDDVDDEGLTEQPEDQPEGRDAEESAEEPAGESPGEPAQESSVRFERSSALFPNERIENLAIETELRESYLTYAMSTIIDRALPDVRDGLKPSQRRVIVAMNDLNLGPRSKHRKSAKIAGDTSGNYHPHGEGVVYPTMVRLGQHWNLRYTLVDPQGNFGSIDGDPPAAMRYTEARMTAPAMEMVEDLNLDTVDMQPNYDDTRTEPTVLPGKFPNLLVNGSQGIAVGVATSLPPHNLREICDALVLLIDHPESTVDDLMKIVKGPDFPTGGMICGRAGIRDGYRTGRGRISVRAKLHTEQLRGGKSQIVVTEIPYQVLKTTIIERIAEVVKAGKIPDITDVQDHSDRDGMRIVVEVRKGAEADVVINQLFEYTPLQSTFSIINIALVNRAHRTLTLRDMMWYFLEHRKEVIRRRTAFLLRRARQRAHLLEGLILAVADIDRIIETIKKSPDVPAAREGLMALSLRLTEAATVRAMLPEQFVTRASSGPQRLTRVQAEAILAMQLQRLTGLEIEKLARDYTALVEEITGYETILGSEQRLLDVIREDIHEIREKYGDERRTEIVGDVGEFDIEDLIAEEDVVVTLTHEGYIKRMPLSTYRKQGRGGQGIIGSDAKEGDFIEELFIASTHDYLLIFLENGRMHWLKVYDIPSLARTSRGRAIVNILQMEKNEKICAVMPVREFDDRFLVTATKLGQIKKTELKAYSNTRRLGIMATGLDEGDMVIGVALTRGSDEIVLATREGKAIRFKETDVRPMGRTAGGVRAIRLKKGDQVVGMVVADPMATLLTVCENGHGKRTSFDEYRLIARGGQGVINISTSERNGKVVAVKAMRDNDELMLITSNGKIVRTGLSGMRVIGRGTQGVRIISMKAGDKLVSVARVVSEDNTQGTLRLEPGEDEGEPELFPRAPSLAGEEGPDDAELEEADGEQDPPETDEGDEQDDDEADAEDPAGDDPAAEDDPSARPAKGGPKRPSLKKPPAEPPAAGGDDDGDASTL